MKFFLIVAVVFSFVGGCYAQTQDDLNKEALHYADSLIQQLVIIEKEVLKDIGNDSLYIKNFNLSRSVWDAYVKAELRFKFPPERINEFGSVSPMCYQGYRAFLIEQRIKELKEIIISEEGDVCR